MEKQLKKAKHLNFMVSSKMVNEMVLVLYLVEIKSHKVFGRITFFKMFVEIYSNK